MDGGVYDNQGTVSRLASNCNVLVVSVAGQLRGAGVLNESSVWTDVRLTLLGEGKVPKSVYGGEKPNVIRRDRLNEPA